MKRKKELYPGVDAARKEAERVAREKRIQRYLEDEPDIIRTAAGICPNYEKFDHWGWDTERALVWCNMD